MNTICIYNNTLYFCGFSDFEDIVSIHYTGKHSPLALSTGVGRPPETCFRITDHTCSIPEIIRLFEQKDALECVFLKVDNRYIQSPIKHPVSKKDLCEKYRFSIS